ncbi:MAG: glycosyltransferase family 1 protein [Nitrososphaerota archaeon]|nr:glycosyltransferase family 1 protein [Nitrososphaerota archaeon]MDG7038494.1 glycosyltransferase family 1 protein [Nitrososphaerota archaeon]MDG7040724.1 glycosyltransferase family 1 protein [Nitrososphaerota archaeon]MDG7043510.1 glycosyltransferase family 1 protein [Nitrososphaerota archaeon]
MTHRVTLIVSRYQTGHWLLRDDLLKDNISSISAEALRKSGPSIIKEYEMAIAFSDMLFHTDEREVLEMVLASFGGPIGIVDDRDDPVVLKLASLPNVVYFKREYRYMPQGAISSIGYWLSWMHLARRLGSERLLSPTREHLLRNRGKILPLPLTVSNSIPSNTGGLHRGDKVYSVSMIANMNLPNNLRDLLASGMSSSKRLKLARLLMAVPGSYIHLYNYDNPKLGYRLQPTAYASVIASSVSSVAPKGSGGDTYRYYEIPALGSVLLSERPSVVIPNDFSDRREALFFRNHGQLLNIINELSSDRKMASSIAKAGYEKYQRYHTPAMRLKYLLDHLSR